MLAFTLITEISKSLLESGKKILGNNFIVYLNNFFSRYAHTPSNNIFMNDSNLRRVSSLTTDIQVLHHDRLKHNKNLIIGYLNINSLRNKLKDLRVILKYLSLDYFVLNTTKLDESFPKTQFTLDGYEIRARRDRNKFGGGLIEYVRKGLICKKVVKYEPKFNRCICSEMTFSKKKWFIFSIYRPPNVGNLTGFFEEMTIQPVKVTPNYYNIIIMGDFNINTKSKSVGSNNISDFCDLFHLTKPVFLTKKKKHKLNNVTERGIITNKNIWTFIKPFLTNKGFLQNKDITIIEGNKAINSERELAKTFNEHYNNIVEKSSKIKPKDISKCDKNQNIHNTIREVIKSYENHLVYCK